MTAELILDLYKIEAIKFGAFKLKSGIISPIYIDLRLTISYPKVLNKIADSIWEQIKLLKFDIICGVPYTAIPFAGIIAATHNIPMVMCRKEPKEHGTKKMVEGCFASGQTCLVIEDLITSGASILETVESLEKCGLVVKDAGMLIDREQNGKNILASKGYNAHAVVTLSQILECLQQENKIDEITIESIKLFLQQHQF